MPVRSGDVQEPEAFEDASHGGNGDEALLSGGTVDEAPQKVKAKKVRFWFIYFVALVVYLGCSFLIVAGSR